MVEVWSEMPELTAQCALQKGQYQGGEGKIAMLTWTIMGRGGTGHGQTDSVQSRVSSQSDASFSLCVGDGRDGAAGTRPVQSLPTLKVS